MNSILSPLTTHFLAHEATQQEIDVAFRELPWCETLVLLDKGQLTRKDWKQDVLRRAEEKLQKGGYQVT